MGSRSQTDRKLIRDANMSLFCREAHAHTAAKRILRPLENDQTDLPISSISSGSASKCDRNTYGLASATMSGAYQSSIPRGGLRSVSGSGPQRVVGGGAAQRVANVQRPQPVLESSEGPVRDQRQGFDTFGQSCKVGRESPSHTSEQTDTATLATLLAIIESSVSAWAARVSAFKKLKEKIAAQQDQTSQLDRVSVAFVVQLRKLVSFISKLIFFSSFGNRLSPFIALISVMHIIK